MIDALPLLLGPEGYQISRSVRLRSSVNAYFTDTLGSGDKKTFTHSVWVKRGIFGVAQTLFGGNSGTAALPRFYFTAADQLEWYSRDSASVVQSQITTNAVYRDPSAWYHIVLAYDTTQADANNRLRIYVNNVLQAVTITTALALNEEPNSTFPYGDVLIGIYRTTSLAAPFDGYLTEINFIEGYPTVAGISYNATTWAALNVSTLFGETNPATGVWQPKKYTGTYGTNGFYLNFSDNSNNTAATIGKDYSGNGNNWTPNNISMVVGTTYDSMLDVPTQWADGGNGRGNYATLNPLDQGSFVTLSNGNLRITGNTASNSGVASGTIGVNSGKWYWETTITTVGGISYAGMGIGPAQNNAETYWIGVGAVNGCGRRNGGGTLNNGYGGYGAVSGITAASFTTGDIISVAVDFDNGALYYAKNGVWENSGVPTSGSSKTGAFNVWTAGAITGFPAGGGYNGSVNDLNCGQRPFAYTPPTGFRALNTLNLPAPTILKGNQYFDVSLWSGNSTNARVITSNVGTVDLAWVKKRNGADDHRLANTVTGGNKHLKSNATDAESTATTVIQAFSGSTFTVGTDNSVNATGGTYVGWTWQEGATQGFDIVTFTNTASSASFNHNLGVTPSMIILKGRGPTAANWTVFHKSLANMTTAFLNLNNANAAGTLGTAVPAPTSTTFGSSAAAIPASESSIAYLFSEVAGFSKFGSYTGNGSADGPFVYTGFRPRFLLFKNSSAVVDWVILDTSRDTYNVVGNELIPNTSQAELANNADLDILSNGFKIRRASTFANGSGNTIIFAAFAENPFKNALAR